MANIVLDYVREIGYSVLYWSPMYTQLHSAHCTVTMYSAQCTLYSLQCTLYAVHGAMYSVSTIVVSYRIRYLHWFSVLVSKGDARKITSNWTETYVLCRHNVPCRQCVLCRYNTMTTLYNMSTLFYVIISLCRYSTIDITYYVDISLFQHYVLCRHITMSH